MQVQRKQIVKNVGPDDTSKTSISKQIGSDVLLVGDLKIKLPDDKYLNWAVVKDQTFKVNKGDLIVDKFNEDFPALRVGDYDELIKLCSRSKKLNEWQTAANVLYSDTAIMPLYLDDVLEPKEHKELTIKVTNINNIISIFQDKRKALAEKYQIEMRKIDSDEEIETSKILKGDKKLQILTLNTTSLPGQVQKAIIGYKPADALNTQESRTMFAREMLVNYKVALFNLIKQNPEIDILKLVDDNQTK
jgi:hypothetical protein